MTDPPVSQEDLRMFRFQIFYEDVISPLLHNIQDTPQSPVDIFISGELREATSVAALAVACDCFPRQPFSSMLEANDVQSILKGDLGRSERESPLPPPITELPGRQDILGWSELDMNEELKLAMPAAVAEYASLIRQINRNRFQRFFNAEMLFSPDDRWQAYLTTLASTARGRFPAFDSPDAFDHAGAFDSADASIWPAEGLDSYLDLATDLYIDVQADASGLTSSFDIPRTEKINTDDIKDMIRSESLFPLMSWRFGGVTRAESVTQRIRSLESVIVGVVTEVDVERSRPGLATGGNPIAP